eukprot:12905675-Prorocentrum_lima.AAC.1
MYYVLFFNTLYYVKSYVDGGREPSESEKQTLTQKGREGETRKVEGRTLKVKGTDLRKRATN